jgi:hypothetical protein
MPDLQFSMTSFGSQKAPKKALLLHGLLGTGPVFFKVADRLVKDGYVSSLDLRERSTKGTSVSTVLIFWGTDGRHTHRHTPLPHSPGTWLTIWPKATM